MKNIKITAKEMVEFIYSGGDLTNEYSSNKRALQGTEAHKYIQDQYSDEDKKEVSVDTLFDYLDYSFYITGRMDGLLQEDGKLIIEEIKSTKTDLSLLKIDSRPEHFMQAKMYAYMYCMKEDLKSITVRLKYVSLDGYQTKDFQKRFNITQLTRFFKDTVSKYTEWLEIYQQHQTDKLRSIEGLTFPFDDYREGQYKFMGAIYQTLVKNDILYSIAPTGIGKTIAALFSSLKTINNETEKVFYLTAKNAGKAVAVDTVNLLKDNGLKAKTVVINSKEHMCLMDTVDCDPEICPYAKGFFDRLREGLNDIFVHEDVYDQTLIKQYGEYHTICPHEFSLSISNYSDIVICDYNYAFDPRTHLIRYFEEDYYRPKLLVDEAHNMVDRSRSMYSSTLTLEGMQNLKKAAKKVKPSITSSVSSLIKYIQEFIEEKEVIKSRFYHQKELDYDLLNKVDRVINKIDVLLSENKKFPTRKQVLDGYFELLQFSRISEYYNADYQFIVEENKGDIQFTQLCLDASVYILDLIQRRSHGTVFFSATLEPIDYYIQLITMGQGKMISIPSPFKQNHLGLFIESSTSTRYKDRDKSIDRIIDTIYGMVESNVGNYIVFFPSYKYMNKVLEEFDQETYDCYIQERNMSQKARSELLSSFQEKSQESKVGFFVLGGSFSEGIDYIGDMLHGVLIVGVAMPMFNQYNELLRSHFDEKFDQGFAYAYTYPGMNKVIQAVGRVIRTEEDRGVAILFDDRYMTRTYRELYPPQWSHFIPIRNKDYIMEFLQQFWNKK
jgi:DNA excision repair protein ERCC-2